MLNEQQISRIQELKPLEDSVILYIPKKWQSLDERYKNLVTSYIDQKISRKDVINAYTEYYTDYRIGIIKPVLLTMIWGYGDDRYGSYRTNKLLSTEGNQQKIKVALDLINENKNDCLQKAFSKLSNVEGLGISFLSKILYFATKAKNIEKYALIFDNKVAKALIKQIASNDICDMVKVQPSSKFKHYEQYNNFMHGEALKYNFTAEQFEFYLFSQ